MREPKRMPVFDAAELESFLALVLANDPHAAIARIERFVAGSWGLTDICLAVLAPAARRLGEMWDDDLCSFVDVTAGMGTLRLIMHRLRQMCGPVRTSGDRSRRILLASLSGDQHSFGPQVAAEAFRESGWDVTIATACTEAELLDMVRSEWFAVAGLSVALDRHAGSLGQTIRAIRQASCNRTIGILAGGSAFVRTPGLARLIGADGTASEANEAVMLADDLRLEAGRWSGRTTPLPRLERVTVTV